MTQATSKEEIKRALDSGEFEKAADLINRFEGPCDAEVLECRGRAAYGKGDLEACLTAFEELYRLHLDNRHLEQAAFAAVMVGMYLMMDTGLMTTVRAWLKRARSLLPQDSDSQVLAWLAAISTYERFMCGSMSEAERCAREAIERGTRHGIAPPVIIGKTALGRVRVHDGRVEEGLTMLDEVALELQTGNLDAMTAGQMWCEVICAMQWVGQHDRAEEWTNAMERWRKGAAFGGLNGRCRVHRAEILRMRGPCNKAEEEALLACEELRPWMRREFGWPLTELGNARLQKGDFAGAEEAYLSAHENAWSPQPGLALLRLAQGRHEEAWALIHDALEHPYDNPSKESPPSGGLRRAPLLSAQVRIALATGRLHEATITTQELGEIAATYRSRTIENTVRAAHGRLASSQKRYEEAVPLLTAAMQEWVELRMPFEAATLRVELAAAHRAAGRPDCAEHELAAAHRMFETLGAERWIDVLCSEKECRDSQADIEKDSGRGQDRAFRQECYFVLNGDMRTVHFAGTTVHFKELKGMRYLERLLLEPGREFHALDLIEVERGAYANTSVPGFDASSSLEPEPGLEVFDATARVAYERRLVEIDSDIAEAERNNDWERARLARADREFLVQELSRGVGLGGRSRKTLEGAERARTAATRSTRYAIERILTHHPSLGEHLKRTIRTGTYFCYEPDPLTSISWKNSNPDTLA